MRMDPISNELGEKNRMNAAKRRALENLEQKINEAPVEKTTSDDVVDSGEPTIYTLCDEELERRFRRRKVTEIPFLNSFIVSRKLCTTRLQTALHGSVSVTSSTANASTSGRSARKNRRTHLSSKPSPSNQTILESDTELSNRFVRKPRESEERRNKLGFVNRKLNSVG